MKKLKHRRKTRNVIALNMLLSRKGGPMRDRRDSIRETFPNIDDDEPHGVDDVNLPEDLLIDVAKAVKGEE